MKRILLTGSTGFIGKNIAPILAQKYQVDCFSRTELNLLDFFQVKKVVERNSYDAVLHFANPCPYKNKTDSEERMTADSLRIFENLYCLRSMYGKMIYAGSGAEYNKINDIKNVKEDQCFDSIPYDSYGLAKYIMNQLAESSTNVFNCRIFGCYGPGDFHTKFITHCIRSIIMDRDITIRKNCKFDYIHVYDLAKLIICMTENKLPYHSYNASGGNHKTLSAIAQIVKENMQSSKKIVLLSKETAKEYTASNERIKNDFNFSYDFPLERGIKMQIEWEKSHWTDKTIFDGE